MNKVFSICLSALLFDVNAMCHSLKCDVPVESPRAIRFIPLDDLEYDQHDDINNEDFCVLSENPILMFSNCCYDDVYKMLNLIDTEKSLDSMMLKIFHRIAIEDGVFCATAPINKVIKRVQKKKNTKKFGKILNMINYALESDYFKKCVYDDAMITVKISNEYAPHGYILEFRDDS